MGCKMTADSSAPGRLGEFGDLEISLHRRDAVSWSVELRYSQPGSDGETKLDVDGPLMVDLDPSALDRIDDTEEYGAALGRSLLGDGVGTAFRTAIATSQAVDALLRVRLIMGGSAAALHGIRWETMSDPVSGSRLLTNESVVFSRYLSSQDWRPVGVRAREDLKALAVIAGPTDLDAIDAGRPLPPVRVDEELARARQGLGEMDLTTLPGVAAPTIAEVIDQMRRGYDVMYLVCHGYVMNDEPVLLLVDDEGHAAPLLGSELVAQLRDLPRLPRLIFLASCQSAGSGADQRSEDAGVLAALGPRLAEAGVPAVVAMQGNVTMTTAATFATAFFKSLDADGLVDRAMAVGRSAIRDRADWWVPTLFMRLRSGRLWYTPGIAPTGEPFDKWPSLIRSLSSSMCTPIIGPGISDALLGTRQEIARTWAKNYGYPLAAHNRDSLPQVAQYLAIHQDRPFMRSELETSIRRTLLSRYSDELPTELLQPGTSLDDLIGGAWEVLNRREEVDPYSVLAELPAPVYVTTQPSRLLARALEHAGRTPEVELCRWNGDGEWVESVFDRMPDYRPTPGHPLIYHLLGTLDDPDSLVLTEDDYFDFLIGVTRNQDLVPPAVRRRLSDSALMFVGFRLDEWDFRVLYRSLMSSEGGNRRRGYSHVAVQIDPEEDASVDTEGARSYLQEYFQDSHVSVYWGTTEHFLRDLRDKWEEHSP